MPRWERPKILVQELNPHMPAKPVLKNMEIVCEDDKGLGNVTAWYGLPPSFLWRMSSISDGNPVCVMALGSLDVKGTTRRLDRSNLKPGVQFIGIEK